MLSTAEPAHYPVQLSTNAAAHSPRPRPRVASRVALHIENCFPFSAPQLTLRSFGPFRRQSLFQSDVFSVAGWLPPANYMNGTNEVRRSLPAMILPLT